MRQTKLPAIATILIAAVAACRDAEQATPPVDLPTADSAGEVRSSPITRIEPGTCVDLRSLPPQTHLVLRSTPKVTDGDVGKVRKSIVEALHTFSTVLLVRAEPDPLRAGRFRRGPFSIGISMPGEKGDVVLTKTTADRLGIGLGFFESRVLAEREKELSTVLSPGTTATMALIDFPTMLRRDGSRAPTVIRYASLVDGDVGRVDTLYWLLEAAEDELRFSEGSLRLLPPTNVIDWEMHVDGRNLTFGVPPADAFSALKLPEGAPLAVPEELKTVAAARAYAEDAGARLERLLRDVLKRTPRTSGN